MITFQAGSVIDGRFRVIDEINRGGMGCVLLVEGLQGGGQVALKYCPNEDEVIRRRFGREVRIMSSINHHNVMPVIWHNENYDPPYFVMPLAARTVADQARAYPDLKYVLDIFMGICAGVQAIHSAGYTHRDIKPHNALMMPDGRVVVTDLGLARFDERDSTALTRTTMFLGTTLYCAPEQMMLGGSRDADARTDVFQLGKVLYELVTGHQPALIDEHRLPLGLGHVVTRATQQQPDRRYKSVAQIMDAVQNFMRAQDPAAAASSQFDVIVEQARSLIESGKYDVKNCEAILETLPQLAGDSGIYTEQFERVPKDLLRVMADTMPHLLERPLELYCNAVEDVVGGYNFAHAEIVADRMSSIFNGAAGATLKITALKATLIAAVKLGRYAAMEVFDRMISSINSPDIAVPAAEMLKENREYYHHMIGRVSDARLHAAIRVVNQEIRNAAE